MWTPKLTKITSRRSRFTLLQRLLCIVCDRVNRLSPGERLRANLLSCETTSIRLHGSRQILEQPKTYTGPHFICTGPAKPYVLNGIVCKLLTCRIRRRSKFLTGMVPLYADSCKHLLQLFKRWIALSPGKSLSNG